MPAITIAYRTLHLLDELVQKDQGASYRSFLKQVMPHIGDAYRTDEEGHRTHLGASILGNDCGRAIWYNFHWATKSNFEGRMIRLFNRGHIEEARFIALLLMLGAQVWQQDANGKQFRISFADGHAGGSGDGVVSGIPDVAPGVAVLGEFKTHNDASFASLAGSVKDWRAHLADPTRIPFTGKGVREAKFEHYVQMQLYMEKMGLPATLYGAVNKNSDDLYMEIVVLDSEFAQQFLARGEKIVWMPTPPEKLKGSSAGFYKCRFCDHRPVCHLKAAPDRNCRTCQYSEPVKGADSSSQGGLWQCTLRGIRIDKQLQLTGCEQYDKARSFS